MPLRPPVKGVVRLRLDKDKSELRQAHFYGTGSVVRRSFDGAGNIALHVWLWIITV